MSLLAERRRPRRTAHGHRSSTTVAATPMRGG